MASLNNLVGKKFGQLTVLRKGRGVTNNERKSVSWVCSCICGKEVDVPKYSLLRKKHGTTHCGCSPKIQSGVCGNCQKSFSSTILRPCKDKVLRCKACTSQHTPMQREYGLTLTDYNHRLELQGGVCAICKRPPEANKRLAIDHDHATGKIRGLLCMKCNLLLGYAEDNLTFIRASASYLLRCDPTRSWDRYFLDIAELVSTRSKDLSTQVGSVIVKDKNLLSTGYNGFPRGWNDNDPKYYERPEKYVITIHAEINAIFNASRCGSHLLGSTLYVTPLPPCMECAKAIAQSGIKEVVVQHVTQNERWVESCSQASKLLSDCGVLVKTFIGT
jgi:dCMP deaminase